MSWFKKPSEPVRPLRGRALLGRLLPDPGPVSAALDTWIGTDPIFERMLDQLEPGRWQESRTVLSTFSKDSHTHIGSAPVVLAFLVVSWPLGVEPYAAYGLHEAAALIDKALIPLRTAAAVGRPGAAPLLAFLEGPGLEALYPLLDPPLRIGHRSLIPLIANLRADPAQLQAPLLALLDAPIPAQDESWHGYTRAEGLRVLVNLRLPRPMPEPPPLPKPVVPPERIGVTPPNTHDTPVDSAHPLPTTDLSTESGEPNHPTGDPVPTPPPSSHPLLARLLAELRSHQPERVRLALDLARQVPGAPAAFLPHLPALIDDPTLIASRDHTRGLALRLWAENARTPAAPPAARLAIGRILALARDASRPTLRAEALDTLRELIPRAAETAFDLAEEALEAPEPAVQSAGLRLLSALATRCPPEPLAEGEE
jgi:hypothetical protein